VFLVVLSALKGGRKNQLGTTGGREAREPPIKAGNEDKS